MTLKKIGILHGMERTFPEAFIDRVNSMKIPGVVAEEVSLGGTSHDETYQYSVIVDRISHEIKYYRGFLKLAALNGTRVINNPFWWTADDKFIGTSIAHYLGIAVPKTILLPNHSYPQGVTDRSLHNLRFPMDWEGMLRHVGLPCIIKPAEGGGGKSVSKIHNLEELWHAYNQSGETQMMLQECIEWDHYVRCLCVGRKNILPIKWHPPFGRPMGQYFVDHEHLTPEMGTKIVHQAQILNEALGYDMNTVEFAIRDGIPYAIDFTNPAPDFDLHSITPHYFGIVVEWMADLAVKMALEAPPPQVNLKWWSLMGWQDPQGGHVRMVGGNGEKKSHKAPEKPQAEPVAAVATVAAKPAAAVVEDARPPVTAKPVAASPAPRTQAPKTQAPKTEPPKAMAKTAPKASTPKPAAKAVVTKPVATVVAPKPADKKKGK